MTFLQFVLRLAQSQKVRVRYYTSEYNVGFLPIHIAYDYWINNEELNQYGQYKVIQVQAYNDVIDVLIFDEVENE